MKPSRSKRLFFLMLMVPGVLGLVACNDDTIIYANDDVPPPPTGVYSITGDRQVEIRWNPVWLEDVAGYGVYWSDTANGEYTRIATVTGRASDFYVASGLTNGIKRYYAVDAFDEAGNESELSYETVHDTPRPSGTGVFVYAESAQTDQAGLDFSAHATPFFVTSYGSPNADLQFHVSSGILYARGTLISGYLNDIQDLGYTDSMDEVSWAPAYGWSAAPLGVELIPGHTYVVWTWDGFFAKFRVVEIYYSAPQVPSAAEIDWAYQVDQNNPELSSYYVARRTAQGPDGGGS
jgi:hypothetical protein